MEDVRSGVLQRAAIVSIVEAPAGGSRRSTVTVIDTPLVAADPLLAAHTSRRYHVSSHRAGRREFESIAAAVWSRSILDRYRLLSAFIIRRQAPPNESVKGVRAVLIYWVMCSLRLVTHVPVYPNMYTYT